MNITYQPKDVPCCVYDDNRFKSLNTALSFVDNTQITTSESDVDPEKYLPLRPDELLLKNTAMDFIDETLDTCATPILAPSYHQDEESFPPYQFDESDLLDPSEVPSNEVTVKTTTIDTENESNNDMVNNIPLELNWDEFNLTPEIQNMFDQFSLQSIDNSIEQRTMSIEIQPPVNLRPRYKSDGTRQIEKSRTKPMAIKLPNLKDINLDPNQLFFLRLILTTYSKNPLDQIYLHVNKLEYHSNDARQLNDDTVCVPLTTEDITQGKKALPRLSIVKTKLDTYKSELTPFSLSGNNDELHEILNQPENEKVSVKQAKDIFKQFKMKASQITCQLLIKQNEVFHFTNIKCETHVMEEKDPKNNSIKKRSVNTIDSDDEESLDERPCTSKSKSSKRKKTF